MPILISCFLFAIGEGEVKAEYIQSESIQTFNDNFWGKFRESVMKDKEKNDPNVGSENTEPSKGGEHENGHKRGGDK